MRDIRIGDRFRAGDGTNFTLEVIEITPRPIQIVIDNDGMEGMYKVGDERRWVITDETYWNYLGNFAKSDNFEELYNLLNS